MIEIVEGSMGGGRLNIEKKTVVLKGKLTIEGNGIFDGKQRVWLGSEKDKELDILQKLYDQNGSVTLTKPTPCVKKVYGRKWRVVYSKDSKKFFKDNKLETPEAAEKTEDKE